MKKMLINFGFMVLALIAVVILSVPANVAAVANAPPVIDSIAITPANPGKYHDLTCTVDVSDADGNLDYVDIKWYVNGALARQTNKLVYGSGDSTFDVFDGQKETYDYVVCDAKAYDFEGAYDHETHAVHVGNVPSNSVSQITYVEITPRHPNPQQDLTCSILAIDADDNLDYVIIEWYRNGYLIRSAAKQIEGSSDTAFDILGESYTNPGDWFKCKATAYDTQGAKVTQESASVSVSGSSYVSYVAYSPYYQYSPYYPYTPYSPYYTYGKPVAVLSVDQNYVDEDENIRFSGDASYDTNGGTIEQYLFDFGDGATSPWISDDLPYAYHEYNHSGTYYARLKVKDNEGVESDWSSSVAMRVAEGTGEHDRPQIDDMTIVKDVQDKYVIFRCEVELFDENEDLDYVKFKWYLEDDVVFTSKEFVEGRTDEADSGVNLAVDENTVVKCEATVYDKEHNVATRSVTTSGYVEGQGCEFTVKRFDYYTYLTEGKKGWVETEVGNAGGASGTVTFKLYVDGSYKEQYSDYVRTGEKTAKRFEFTLAVGNHKAVVEIATPCGKMNRTAEITIFPASSPVFIPGNGGNGAGTGEITETSVIIAPEAMDIEVDTGETVSVYIESPALAKFAISVEGLPDNWANYPAEVEVEGSKTAYIYIVPKALGNYDFKVKVRTGAKTFEKDIELYVAPAGKQNGNADTMAGLVSALESNWLIGVGLLAILAVLAALYFFAGRVSIRRKKYEDHVYGDRKTPYYGPYYQNNYAQSASLQPRMMKGNASLVPARTQQPRRPEGRGVLNIDAALGWPGRFTEKYSDGSYFPKFGRDF